MKHQIKNHPKVLHLMGSVEKGGVEVLLLDLFKHYMNSGEQNNFLLFYKGGYLQNKFLTYKGVKFLQVKTKIQLLFQLRKFVISNKIDIIHCHSPIHVIYAFLSTFRLPIKIVLTSHGYSPSIKSLLLLQLAIKWSEKVFFVSSSFKNRLANINGIKENVKFKILYNGLDTHKISYLESNAKGLESKLILGMIGNFYNDGRDQITICKAAKLLKERGLHFKFEFAGGASKENTYYLDQCINYIKANDLMDCVQFLGFQDDAYGLLKKWDVFIYSSNRDTFGIAVVEAMMAGIPVIVNDLDVFEEISDNGKYATLYPTKNQEALAVKIEEYAKNPELFIEKASKAAVCMREKFSIERHAERLNSLYIELINIDS